MTTKIPLCAVHHHRDYTPLDAHHIWPKAQGGPTIPWNLVTVCPTGHREIHEYLALLLKTDDGKVSWLKRRKYGRYVQTYARLGFERIRKNVAPTTEEDNGAPGREESAG